MDVLRMDAVLFAVFSEVKLNGHFFFRVGAPIRFVGAVGVGASASTQ